MGGLERVLGIYNLGTVHNNETYAMLLVRYINQVAILQHPDATPMIQHLDSLSLLNPDTALKISDLRKLLPVTGVTGNMAAEPKRLIHMKFYCIPDSLAAKYADELGFVQPAMLALLQAGKIYGADPGQGCF